MEVDDEQPLVRLKTSDGKRFALTKSQACCSNTLRSMIENFRNNSNTPTEYINLDSVSSQMLSKIVEWTEWHSTSTIGNSNHNLNEPSDATYQKESNYQLTDTDKRFLESMSEVELLKLTHVANYLDVKTLFSACCQLIAKRWEGKKVAEIRKMYGIEGDFSYEEESQMIQDNRKLGMND